MINVVHLDRQDDLVNIDSVLESPFAQVENILKNKSIILKDIKCLGRQWEDSEFMQNI